MPSSMYSKVEASEYVLYYVKEDITMKTKMKFFAGVEAGLVGYTNNGYPIRDYQLVSVQGETGVIGVFQVREVRGVIGEDGEFRVAKPECRSISTCSSCEPEYELVYWLDGAKVPDEELQTRYEVADVTDIVNAISAFALAHPETDSPYFSKKAIQTTVNTQLDARKKKDKVIIDAVKAAMND